VSAKVLGLGEIDEADAALVGGKAFHLAQLLRAGFPVPAGFCLTTAATEIWNDDARQALLEAYRRMGGGSVAVRSSAPGEDGENASYAGIFCSVLAVDGEAALIAAVERCLASLHAPSARRYRDNLGIAATPAMAVLILRMVDARAAGIAYTCAPLDPARRHIHVNTVWGLAEPLASGRVEGDGFVVSRSGKLLHRNLTDKPFRLTAAGEQAVPEPLRQAASMTDAEAKLVARLAIKAEKFFGKPQDVEFAFDDGQLWLLQSRPIAVSAEDAVEVEQYLRRERRRLARKCAALRRKGVVSGSDIVYSNGNIGELLPTPTTMSFGLFRRIFAGKQGSIVTGRLRLGYCFSPDVAHHLFERIAGQPYFNLELDAATFDYGASPPIQFYLDQVCVNPALANYPEVNLYCQHYATPDEAHAFSEPVAAKAVRLAGVFRAHLAGHARKFLPRFPTEIEPRLAQPATHEWQAYAAPQAVEAVGALMRNLRAFACVEFVVAARLGFYFAALARRRLSRLLGAEGENLYALLLSGLSGSLVTQQTLHLEQVARGEQDMAAFLDMYGHTARNELEIAEPRLAESPAMLESMLHDLKHSGRSPAEDFARKQAQRLEAEQALIESLHARGVGDEDRRELLEDLELAQRFLPLRETIKHYYTARYAEIRRGLLRLERLLGWERDLIFHLYPEELSRAVRDPAGFERRATARKKDWLLAAKAVRQQSLPDVIFASNLQAMTGRAGSPDDGENMLQGTPLSPGRIQGIARIIDPADLESQEFSGNDILVLRSANLGIAPLLRVVAGMVVEVGGLLAHGACQAREAGVPAVVLPQATHLIANGVTLCLDGSLGTVEVVVAEEKRKSSHERACETV
jgi:pyruvate,water dikinase